MPGFQGGKHRVAGSTIFHDFVMIRRFEMTHYFSQCQSCLLNLVALDRNRNSVLHGFPC